MAVIEDNSPERLRRIERMLQLISLVLGVPGKSGGIYRKECEELYKLATHGKMGKRKK